MRFTFTYLLVLLFNASQAQLETSNWYLTGNRIKVTPTAVSTGLPLPNSFIYYTGARPSSISDASGNLLLATNGTTIIDRNQNVMPSILNINLPGTGGKTLIQKVPNTNRYLVFYIKPNSSQVNTGSTLKYAIVDLSLNNGNGDVVSYDNVIETNSSPSYTLAEGKNTNEIWLVTHRCATDSFLSYQITSAGISNVPVLSRSSTIATPQDYIFRDLKTSFDGSMIAGVAYRDYTYYFAYTITVTEVFTFNAVSGTISSKVRSLRQPGYFYSYLSIDFSPDNRLLYECTATRVDGLQPCGFGSGRVVQYNLCYTDTLDFYRYSTSVASDFQFCYPMVSWGHIKTGADKRIHMPYTGVNVSTINNPNRIGTYSNYVFKSYSVPAGNSGMVTTPDFQHRTMEKAIKNNIVYQGGCYPAPIQFAITNDTIKNIAWNFGDLASGNNTSTQTAPSHLFSSPGIYTVTAILYNSQNSKIETLTELVEIKDNTKRLLNNYPRDTTFCSGGSVNIKFSVVNGIFFWYQLYNGNKVNTRVSDSMQISYSGKWYVQMRQNDCNGCILIDSINVNVLEVPYVSLGNDRALCSGDSVRIGVYDYYKNINCTWSTGETTDSIWVRTAGQYWVSADISGNNCPKRDTVNFSINPAVNFSLPADTVLCSGQTLLLNPSITGATYQWQNNSTASTFTVNAPGTYWVKVTKSGCSKTDSIKVNYVSAAQVNLGADTSLCIGSSLALSTSIAADQFFWSTGAVTPSIQVNTSGTYWLRIQKNGCSATDTIIVQFNPVPSFSLGSDTGLCEKNILNLSASLAGATYQWQDNSTASSYSVTQQGLYWLNITRNGCSFRDSIRVTYNPLPTLALGNDTTICAGAVLQLYAFHPNTAKYLWQDGSSNANYTVSTGGLYFVEAVSINGCIKRDSIIIQQTPLPSFNLGADTMLCSGTGFILSTGINNNPNLWSTGAVTSTININTSGIYWAEVDNNGCKKRDSVNVIFKPNPLVNLGSDTLLCNNQAILLNAANSNSTYLWQNGSTQSQFAANSPGSYHVSVNMNGCISRDTINISYNYNPVFSLGTDKEICEGYTIVLDPGITAPGYLWQDGSTGRTFTAKQPGVYYVRVTNSCGSAEDTLSVKKGICNLYIPNSFTPNRDGLNDVFKVTLGEPTTFFRMRIYNRFGQVVFESNDKQKGWDGKFKGLDQDTGAFVYIVDYILLSDGKKYSGNGSLFLLR